MKTTPYKAQLDNGMLVYTYAQVSFYDSSGTFLRSITLTPDKFRATGNNYSQSGGSVFPIGLAQCESVVLTISNQYNEWSEYDWRHTRIDLLSVVYPNGLNNSAVTLAREGRFYPSNIKYIQNAIEITAYDMICFMNNKFVITNAPAGQILYPTVWDYFVYLCDDVLADKLGYTLPQGQHLYASHLDTDRFTNSDFVLDDIVPDNNSHTTLRDAFGYIAQLACGNIVVKYEAGAPNGYVIDILPYSLTHTEYGLYNGMTFADTVTNVFDGGVFGETVTDTLTGGDLADVDYILLDQFTTAPTLEYTDVELTGITMTYHVPSADDRQATVKTSDDNVLSLENPLLQVSSLDSTGDARVRTCVQNIYDSICEKPFRPFDGSFRNDPLVEFMDNVIVIDGWGCAHNSFVTENTYNYLGGSDIGNKVTTTNQSDNVFYR